MGLGEQSPGDAMVGDSSPTVQCRGRGGLGHLREVVIIYDECRGRC